MRPCVARKSPSFRPQFAETSRPSSSIDTISVSRRRRGGAGRAVELTRPVAQSDSAGVGSVALELGSASGWMRACPSHKVAGIKRNGGAGGENSFESRWRTSIQHAPSAEKAGRSEPFDGGSRGYLADALIAAGGVTAPPAAPEKPERVIGFCSSWWKALVGPGTSVVPSPPPHGRAAESRRRP